LTTRERVPGRAASRVRVESRGPSARTSRRTWKQVRARVVSQREYGAGFRWLELELPAGFAAPVAGQFVQLLLDFPSPVLLPRPMSVASVRRVRSKLRVGFLYAAVGAGTRALAELPAGAGVDDHFAVLGRRPVRVDDTGDIRREKTVATVVVRPGRGELHVRRGAAASDTHTFRLSREHADV